VRALVEAKRRDERQVGRASDALDPPEGLLDRATRFGRVEDPLLGRDAGLDPRVLVVRARCTVREQDGPPGEELGEGRQRLARYE